MIFLTLPLCPGTNSFNFSRFLKFLLKKRQNSGEKPLWICLGGHLAHHCPKDGIRDQLTSEAFKPFFLPLRTSWFNR